LNFADNLQQKQTKASPEVTLQTAGAQVSMANDSSAAIQHQTPLNPVFEVEEESFPVSQNEVLVADVLDAGVSDTTIPTATDMSPVQQSHDNFYGSLPVSAQNRRQVAPMPCLPVVHDPAPKPPTKRKAAPRPTTTRSSKRRTKK
jgi:hypothetical protein